MKQHSSRAQKLNVGFLKSRLVLILFLLLVFIKGTIYLQKKEHSWFMILPTMGASVRQSIMGIGERSNMMLHVNVCTMERMRNISESHTMFTSISF